MSHDECTDEFSITTLSDVIGLILGVAVCFLNDLSALNILLLVISFALLFYVMTLACEIWGLSQTVRFVVASVMWLWFYYWSYYKDDYHIGFIFLLVFFVVLIVIGSFVKNPKFKGKS